MNSCFLNAKGLLCIPVAIVIFILLTSEYLWRHKHDRPCRKDEAPRGEFDKGLRRMVLGLRISVILLTIR